MNKPDTSPPKIDRRVRRTKKLLGEALLQLIVERDYDSISISDITDRADLNRATFYLHYGTKEELLIETLEERFDELIQQMTNRGHHEPLWSSWIPEQILFEHVAEHAQVYKVLLGGNGNGYVAHRIISYIAEEIENDARKNIPAGVEPPIPVPIVAYHTAGGLYALVSWWLAQNMPYPPEYMAQIGYQLCVQGTGVWLEGIGRLIQKQNSGEG